MVDLFNNANNNEDDDELISQNKQAFYSTSSDVELSTDTDNSEGIIDINMDFTLDNVLSDEDKENNKQIINKEENTLEIDDNIPINPIDDENYLRSLEEEYLDKDKVQEVSHKHLDLMRFNYNKDEISLAVEEELSDAYPFFFIKGKMQKIQVENILNKSFIKRGKVPIKYKNKDLLLTICSIEPIPENIKNLLRTLNNNLYYVENSNSVKKVTPLDFIQNAVLNIE